MFPSWKFPLITLVNLLRLRLPSSSIPPNPHIPSSVAEEPSSSRLPRYVAPPSCIELRKAERKVAKQEREVANLESELRKTTIKSLKFEFECQSLKEEKENWEEENLAMEE